MIYITGDTHGDLPDLEQRVKDNDIGPGDILIIAGDFGFVWGTGYSESCLTELGWKPFTIAFIDGNHENFDLLEQYPMEDWNGGRVHRIKPNIVHLMRGEAYVIEGKRFFCFGGAYSMDKAIRHPGTSWWPQELPTNEDYVHARETLESLKYETDYVITHTIPQSMIHRLGLYPDRHDGELTGYFEWLYHELKFKRWFAGHFHEDREFNGDFEILFRKVVRSG